jgi:hypothetical protein
MVADGRLSLPTELWMRVLGEVQEDGDLPHLWVKGRQVSTAWRQIVEDLFRKNQLPVSKIEFSLGVPSSCPFTSASNT